MKLFFLANADSIHSKKWIEYFAIKDHEIHWLSLTPSIFDKFKNIKFYLIKKFPIKYLRLLLNILPLRRLIKKINPDILHAHYAGVNGILGALSGFHPLVLTAWGSDVLIVPKSKIIKPLTRFILRKADLITCDADHMKKAIVKLGINAEKIKIIYFGIDVQKFCPGPKDEKLKEKLGVHNELTVISLRNLEPIYNIETLVRAVPIILKGFPETKFLIAGKGSEENKLKDMIKSLRIEEKVKFIGFISNDDLPRYLRVADIYVSTSLSDAGIATSTAEAMASGLPVVITNTGENEKWIEGEQKGYLVPVKNSEILAEKIIDLLKDAEERKIFGEKNRKVIEERNNYYKEMEKMEKLYEEIAKKS